MATRAASLFSEIAAGAQTPIGTYFGNFCLVRHGSRRWFHRESNGFRKYVDWFYRWLAPFRSK